MKYRQIFEFKTGGGGGDDGSGGGGGGQSSVSFHSVRKDGHKYVVLKDHSYLPDRGEAHKDATHVAMKVKGRTFNNLYQYKNGSDKASVVGNYHVQNLEGFLSGGRSS